MSDRETQPLIDESESTAHRFLVTATGKPRDRAASHEILSPGTDAASKTAPLAD